MAAPRKWALAEARELDAFARHIRRLVHQHGYAGRIRLFRAPIEAFAPATDALDLQREGEGSPGAAGPEPRRWRGGRPG